MRTIVAGSRGVSSFELVEWVCLSAFWQWQEPRPEHILCGLARGVDALGEKFAHKYKIPVKYYPADWAGYGRSAGHVRNMEMSRNADALIAIWDGASPGTKHMIDMARARHIETYIHVYTPYAA